MNLVFNVVGIILDPNRNELQETSHLKQLIYKVL